ncbi:MULTISPECIES: restriction endonuclease subunit S [Legionella]|nr:MULTISPECIES: restriction endonuclease subunit S [Legionella]
MMNKPWSSAKLKDVCHKITDGTHKTPIYQDNGIVFLSARNIKNGALCFSNHKFISEKEHNDLTRRCKPEEGDVLLSKSGSLGDAVVIPKLEFVFSIFESLALLKIKKDILMPSFLNQYLNSPFSKRYFWSITSGIAVKHLHLVDLKEMPIVIPPLKIQHIIVDTLNVWDKTINKTKALITVKERQFEWLMNNLIIKPSNNLLSSRKLSNLSKLKKGQQLNRILLTKTDLFPAWNGGITPSGYTDTWNTPEGTVTISEGGNSCGFVNYCKEKFWCGGHCYALLEISHEIDPEFLFYFLKAHEKQIMSLRVGSGLPNIQRRDIEKLEIAYPQLSEQRKIVRILSEAQKEISILKLLTDKYIHQKRGLMQKLLTGAWQVLKLQEEVA